MKIGLVTCQRKPLLIESEQLLLSLFEGKGHPAEPVVWDDTSVNWKKYDALIVRSIWDYHLKATKFEKWLDHIEGLNIPTLNPIGLIRKNKNKRYLLDLQEQGITITPTVFLKKTDQLNLSFLKDMGWEKMVIKPAVSASAFLTKLFSLNEIEEVENEYKSLTVERDFLVQEFLPEINTMGELSLMFFNRNYSHTVLKVPKTGEFRVQENYGGKTVSFQPDDATIQYAQKILSLFGGAMLYARVDGVFRDNQFILMEVELIEPELFLNYHENTHDTLVKSAIELLLSNHK